MTSQNTFKSKEESVHFKYCRKQSNERYPHFKQLNYTVGDEEQFVNEISDIYWGKKKMDEEKDDKLNMFYFYDFDFWEGYHKQEKINLIQTFRYIFYKFKKGMYVKIENNRVLKFIPISNANFTNEWSEQIKMDYSIFKKVSNLENRPYNEKSINKFVNCWFCNNCLLRYEYPVNESDTNVSNIMNFFEELCLYRKVPNIDFFVNKRDFPLLSKNKTEPYYDIWGKNKPLVSHKYDTYLPILSMSKSEEYADILIPTHEDWARVQQNSGIYFTDSRAEKDKKEVTSTICFNSKKPTAVFRGSSTGDGLTIETNSRLKAAFLSSQNKIDPLDHILYLDCGITKWNSRVKKLNDNTTNIQVIDPELLPFALVDYMSLSEQEMKYKYILHIDGHVSAFRLSMLLSLNCVILIVESKWKLWYSDLLVPYEHYIPIKENLSDIYEQIQWCKEHDEMCELIAYNAMEFASKYLGKDGMFDYTQKMLIELKRHMLYVEEFHVNPLPPLEIDEVTLTDDLEVRSTLFENRNVIIRKVKGVPLIIKEKKKKQSHISLPLLKFNSINFCSMYGYEKGTNNIVMDYVEGIKLYDYLLDKKLFQFEVYINVLIQISMALYDAQKERLFVHNDLTPWNIILQFHQQNHSITYDNNRYHISSKVIPVIIDYDKCHVIDEKNIHRGSVNPYKFSSIQDILTLLFTSLFQIITYQNLSREELSLILKISNFISNTKYNPTYFKTIHQLKEYLYSAKKHSSLIYSDKFDLEQLGPLDFVIYLNKSLKLFSKGYLKCKDQHHQNNQLLCCLNLSDIQYDEYTFWSHSKCLKIFNNIKSIDTKYLLDMRQKFPNDIKLLKNISDIITFKTIYK